MARRPKIMVSLSRGKTLSFKCADKPWNCFLISVRFHSGGAARVASGSLSQYLLIRSQNARKELQYWQASDLEPNTKNVGDVGPSVSVRYKPIIAPQVESLVARCRCRRTSVFCVNYQNSYALERLICLPEMRWAEASKHGPTRSNSDRDAASKDSKQSREPYCVDWKYIG